MKAHDEAVSGMALTTEQKWDAIKAQWPWAIPAIDELGDHHIMNGPSKSVILGSGSDSELALDNAYSRLPAKPAPEPLSGGASEGGMTVDESLSKLRDVGWSVAVHNDYRINGQAQTFWLFTHPSGVWVKGEGNSDIEALRSAREDARRRLTPEAAAEEDDMTDQEINDELRSNGICPDELIRNACSRFITEAATYISRGESVPPAMIRAIHQFSRPRKGQRCRIENSTNLIWKR